MEPIHFRKAKEDDHKFIFRLTEEVMKNYVKEIYPNTVEQHKYFQENCSDIENTRLICSADKIIGRITVREDYECFYLYEIHLLPEMQGQGIGRAVILNLIENSVKKNKDIYLKVLKNNPVIKLYKKLGFDIYNQSEDRFYMRYSC